MNTDEKKLIKAIEAAAASLPQVTLMEVCGTHTHEIRRLGVREALPGNVCLVSGPGCPVCVTHEREVFAAVSVAAAPGVIFCCYGDMMRVPCSAGSLLTLKENGADVRIVISPLDALAIARENPGRQVVFFGVGFETTTPHTAALAEAALAENVKNLSILCAHKTMPGAIRTVLGGAKHIDGLICPGHVAAVTGRAAFDFVPREFSVPGAVAGFDAAGILCAVLALLGMIKSGESRTVNMYPGVVDENGNRAAKELVGLVFEPCKALWRGLGEIPGSGLRLRGEYAALDAVKRFTVPEFEAMPSRGCICGRVLKGEAQPEDCSNFASLCTPFKPIGPCMVSSEGSCAAAYKYRRDWLI